MKMKLRTVCLLFLFTSTILPAHAGTADEELLFAEIPMVYAASRHAEPVSQAPAAVTIITHDEIVKYGYRSLNQALASVSGMFITDDHGYTANVGARGLGVPAASNLRVLFLLNGLPVVDKYWTVFFNELTPDMLDAIDRIEVIKGPGSALYGNNAIEGVVNIITRTGADVHGLVTSAEGGDHPSGKGVVTYGNVFENGLDLFFSGHFEQDNGQHSLDFGTSGKAVDHDEHQLYSLFTSVKYKDLALQVWYAERHKDLPAGLFGTIVADDANRATDKLTLVDLRWEHDFDNDMKWMVRSYYQSFPDASVFAYDFSGFFVKAFQQNSDQWVGYETQFSWRPVEKHLVTLGAIVEYHWTWLTGHLEDNTGTALGPIPGSTADFPYWASYVQDDYHILTNLTLTTGLRFDAFPAIARTGLSPRAALVWGATPQTTVKLLFGKAFRSPSEFEREYPAAEGLGPENPDIASEQITTYELVVEQRFRDELGARLSVFHNDIKDLIDIVSIAPIIYDNRFDIHTTGLEAELTKRFSNGVRGFLNGSWQHSEFDGGPQVNSPTWVANLGVICPIIGDKLAVALRQNYVSSRQTFAGQNTKDAYPTDLTISSEDWIKNWSFNFGVQNLFDQHYTVPAAADGSTDTIPENGRTIVFRATYKF